MPPVFIEQSNVLCTEVEVVRIVDKTSMKFWRIIDNSSDNTGIFLLVLLLREADGLVFEYVVCSIENTLAIDELISRFALLPNDKECSEYIDSIKSGEVKVASVKHIACQRLVCEPVHRVDIVHLGIGDSVENRYLRDDVNLSMDSDARFCPCNDGLHSMPHHDCACCGIMGFAVALWEFLHVP